jgi:hypothetical protein
MIPEGAWITLAVLELIFSLCLVLPAFYKPAGILAPIAASCIGVVMLIYCVWEIARFLNQSHSGCAWTYGLREGTGTPLFFSALRSASL